MTQTIIVFNNPIIGFSQEAPKASLEIINSSDVQIQISADGRVWIHANGQLVMRAKSKRIQLTDERIRR